MRLQKVETGHAFKEKLLLTVIRLVSGERVMDVLRVLKYRPALFGDTFSPATQGALRGPSDWTLGERELIASFVSSRNQCLF